MHPYVYAVLGLSAISLAACTRGGTGASSAALTTIPFACPSEGTQAKRIGSSTVATYGKSDPSDPVVCKVSINGQQETRWLYNWWRLPTSNEMQKRAALASAFQGGPEYCYSETNRPASSTGYSADVNSSYIYEHCWQQIGQKYQVVNGKQFTTLSIRDTEEGRAGNAFAADRIIYYDLDSKQIVKVDVVNRRGTPISGYEYEILRKGGG